MMMRRFQDEYHDDTTGLSWDTIPLFIRYDDGNFYLYMYIPYG